MMLSAKLTVDSISSVDIHTSISCKVVRGVPVDQPSTLFAPAWGEIGSL